MLAYWPVLLVKRLLLVRLACYWFVLLVTGLFRLLCSLVTSIYVQEWNKKRNDQVFEQNR